MKVTRKGFYVIEDPNGEILLREDGSIMQMTSRDECYERILEDGRSGDFRIHCPDRVVSISPFAGATSGDGERDFPATPNPAAAPIPHIPDPNEN